MKLTIGVMGSSGGHLSGEAMEKAYRLGTAVAEHDAILITGGCPGLPYESVRGAKSKGGFVGGRTGTLGELAIAYDEGRLIGVLTGTGGITTLVEEIIRVGAKDTGACVVYEDDPATLVERLIHVYRTSHVRKPSCFCDAHGGG